MIGKYLGPKKKDALATYDDNLLPTVRRDDDIFLVSFPRSGNTWISFILANMIVEKLNLGFGVNFFNIHGFIPDIHQGRNILKDLGYFPFKRIIKSHAAFHPDYKNVIYIIRDPKSVLVSYYRYLVGLGGYEKSLRDFIRDENFGMPSWVHHVESWLNGIIPGTRFRLIKYEDFLVDPHENIAKLGRLLGADFTDDQINRICLKTSFEAMQKLEKESGSLSINRGDKRIKFIRQGKLDGWKIELGGEDVDFINSVFAEMSEEFGYR